MRNQINMTIPVNSLGYGMQALGFYHLLKEAGYNIHVKKIGSNFIDPSVLALLENLNLDNAMQEDIKRRPLDAANYIVWHPKGFLDNKMTGVPNIGSGCFEIEPITAEDQIGFSSVDVAVTHSDWGLSQIVNPNKCLVHGPSWSTYGLHLPDAIDIPKLNSNPLFMSPGKWEERKSHPLLTKILTRRAMEGKNFSLLAFWDNIFTGNLNQPLTNLRGQGWVISNLYNFNNQMCYNMTLNGSHIFLMDHIVKYTDMLALYKKTIGMISLSKGEGWDMPAIDALGLGIPALLTDNTAHLEYSNSLARVEYGEHKIISANDGIWFRDEGNWYTPDEDICNIKVNMFMDKCATGSKWFWTDEYVKKLTTIQDPNVIVNQIETAIGKAENVISGIH